MASVLLWLAEATFTLALRGYVLPSVTFSDEGGVRTAGGCYDVVESGLWLEVTPC